MQYVDRNRVPPPTSFRGDAARNERFGFLLHMQETSARISQTTPSRSRFELTSDETLSALDDVFHGKCAYCETRGLFQARYFRPDREAEPLARSEFAHLYYAWLRTDWGNVYATCGECAVAAGNRFPTSRSDRGPLPGLPQLEAFANENYGVWRFGHYDKRKILDPCEDRSFANHLSFSLSGRVEAFSNKGAETIAIFALDRESLVSSRADAFRTYISTLKDELERGVQPNVFDFASLEYGGGWTLLLRRILKATESRIDRNLRFHPDQIGATLARVWITPIERQAFLYALDDVRRQVERPTIERPSGKGATRRPISIAVRNFKALQNLRLSLPPSVTADPTTGLEAEASALLILGENAAGKSSILEAIALALMDAKVRASIIRSPRNFILDPSLMGSDWAGLPASANVTLGFDDGTELTLEISDSIAEAGVADNLPLVFAYGAFRQYASSSPKAPPKGHVTTLFKSDALLANPEEWLLNLPDDEFAMVARALQRILIIEGDYEIVERDRDNRRCLVVTKIGDGAGACYVKTPLRVVSSGFRSILAMICDVLAGLLSRQRVSERKSFGELEPVVLIDEVEAHLHPRWKMQIMTALRRVLPKALIIATTHDPLCLRGMHDQEVIVLNRTLKAANEDPNTLPVLVEAITALPNVDDLTIEQLLTSDFFSMFSTDAPAMELRLAKLGDLIARETGDGLTQTERDLLDGLRTEIIHSLPLGSSEVQRLVEEAVFDHVQKRRGTRGVQLDRLKAETRERIAKALEAY